MTRGARASTAIMASGGRFHRLTSAVPTSPHRFAGAAGQLPSRRTVLPEIDFIDDKAGKRVGINRHIGRRPIASFGNSDGDLQMLQWTAAGDGARFCLLVHHTDAEREWAYDRDSHVGRLNKALDEARQRGWAFVDMKNDWKTIHPAVANE